MGNRYIDKFFSLRCAPDVLATVGTVAHMEKELTEAIGILRHVQRIVLRDKSKPFLLLDFCAGNALASVLAVHLFSNVTAIAVDVKVVERNLRELAELGGGVCQAAIELRRDLKEGFAVLKAALTLLKAKSNEQ